MATTPGPWHYDGRRWIRDAAGIGVLRVQIGANPDDARCAAAAPALLAALKEILEYAGGQETALDDDYVMERVRAAIAASNGRPWETALPAL